MKRNITDKAISNLNLSLNNKKSHKGSKCIYCVKNYVKNFLLVLILLLFLNQDTWGLSREPKVHRGHEGDYWYNQNKKEEKEKPAELKLDLSKTRKWKRLEIEIAKNMELLKKSPRNINTISTLALLQLYKEDYKKSYELFHKLDVIMPSMLHLFYKSMSLSIVNPFDAPNSWRLYFSSVDLNKEVIIWQSLAQLVNETLQQRGLKDKKLFREVVYWLFTQKAYYSSFMAVKIFEDYLAKHEKDAIDEEFIHSIRVGILMKLGYMWDAIDYLEKLEIKQQELTDDQKRKLGFSYYFTGQYKLAIEKLLSVSDKRKNSLYYYYLSLCYLENENPEQYKETVAMLKKQKDRNTSSLLDALMEKQSENSSKKISSNIKLSK